MGPSRKPVGNIHRIREFELEKVILSDEFDILQIVGEGWFGKILLVEHRATETEMVLKALPKPYVSLRDFYREFHFGLHLGVHKNIVTTYDVAFETAGFYVFTQEYAPLGDLTSNVMETGIGEIHTKRVAKQIGAALDFMHSKDIVHRDVKLDNVLVCRSDFSRVKLCDFGESRKDNTLVQRRNEWLPYSPPEVLLVNTDESYKATSSHDVWQFGIVIFVCLTGCLPWQKAAPDDPRYTRYIAWHGSSIVIPMKRTPKLFKLVSSRASKMFRKFLEPNKDRRPNNIGDLQKFLDDRWLAKGGEKNIVATEPDELCASMYSFHSSAEEKNKLLSTLAQHGIETTVDRVEKKKRIRDWIQSSVIAEEDEEDNSGTNTPSSTNSRTPVAGHVSSVRAMEQLEKKITTTVKDASNKHIDPRTGLIQQGPSEMGVNGMPEESKTSSATMANGSKNQRNSPTSSNSYLNGSNGQASSNQQDQHNYQQQHNHQQSQQQNQYHHQQHQQNKSQDNNISDQTMVNGRLNFSVVNKKEPPKLVHQLSSENRRLISPDRIVDSGYGSLDKLKSTSETTASGNHLEHLNKGKQPYNNSMVKGGNGNRTTTTSNGPYYSPILSKRSESIKSAGSLDYLKRSAQKLPNQISFTSEEDEEVNSDRGSSGFVHLVGTSSSTTAVGGNSSMKDNAYDRFVNNITKSANRRK